MPLIAIASPKGGAAKTTTALVLSTTLAEMGASVIVFDCDRNRPLGKRWKDTQSKLPLTVIENTNETTIVDALDEARTKAQFVVCDLEGAGSLLMSRAIGRASFVIIPLQPSDLDADEAAKAVGLVHTEQKMFGRKIDHRVLWTRTNPVVKTRIEREILGELAEGGVPTFKVQLNERQPFRAILRARCALSELADLAPDLVDADSIRKARANAQTFVDELLGYLVPSEKELAA